ncbi:hypothetical protein HDU86_007142 [Geranomyces michiganensis]|nr:hypothetical protein HDU86_007142 [Geranomyces michiganensis]
MMIPPLLFLLILVFQPPVNTAAASPPAQYHLLASPGAHDIRSCPDLPPRRDPATSVRDLRIDDIRVVAALGDR